MTNRAVCITIALLVPISFISASLAMSESDIADRGLVRCLTEFCDAFDLGAVPTKEAIEQIPYKDTRDARNRDLAKVQIALSTLRVLAEHLQASDLLPSDRCEIFRQLARLRDKGISAHQVGVGNLEFAAVVSMLMSGVFFQVYEDIDEVTRHDLLTSFPSSSALASAHAYRSALALEGCHLPERSASLQESSQQLAIQAGFPNVSNDTKVAVLDALAKELQRRAEAGNAERLLTHLDMQWLAWDLLWATRLNVLCLLTQHLPVEQATSAEEAARQFRTMESAIAALSAAERDALNAKFASSQSGTKRVAHTMIEVQDRLENKGRHVLAMVAHRLGSSE